MVIIIVNALALALVADVVSLVIIFNTIEMNMILTIASSDTTKVWKDRDVIYHMSIIRAHLYFFPCRSFDLACHSA